MKYSIILNRLAKKYGVSKKEIKKEMQYALKSAGVDCSVQDFLKASKQTIEKTIYSNFV